MLNDLTGFPVLREGTLRAAPFQAVPALLARFGVRPAGPCRDAGIPVALLSDPEGVISIEQAGRLLASCVRHTGCVPFGLLLGESFSLDTLGPIGALARGARDVGAALTGIVLALHLHDRVTVPALRRLGREAALATIPLGRLEQGAPEIADLTMMACRNIVRDLAGPGWSPGEVRLARRAPADRRVYERRLGAPVRFDGDHNALVFDAAWLSRPVAAQARPGVSLEQVAARHPLDLPALVRRACVQAILEGDGRVARLAALAGCGTRTLNRRLARVGTTARAEMNRVKLEMAMQLLLATDLPLVEVSALLGYADAAAFTRAFRTGLGRAPSEWRRRRREDGANAAV